MSSDQRDFARVVGAGITDLCGAHELRRAGSRVAISEGRPAGAHCSPECFH